MMVNYENHCVSCHRELGCLGSTCPYINVPVYYCDECGCDNASYEIEGEHFCETCAERYLNEIFDDNYTILEKAELIEVDMREL